MSGPARTGASALLPLGCAALALGIYSMTLAPTISWSNYPRDASASPGHSPDIILSEDSAELAGAATTLGIAHSPGYPLFVLLGHLFTRLPLGDEPAYRTNLFSAVCAAAAVACFWLVLYGLTGRALAASIASLLLAFSYTFWYHAIVTEVHALHLALLAISLALAVRAVQTAERRWLYAWAFVAGLGLANHLTTVLFLPGFLVLLWPLLWTGPRPLAMWLRLAACYAAGLAPYLFVPLRAAQDPAYNWGDATTPARLWALVSGAEFHAGLKPEAGPILTGIGAMPGRLVTEFGVLACVLGAAGWIGWVGLRRRPQDPPRQGRILAALALMGVAVLAFASSFHIPDVVALQLPAHLVFAVGIGLCVALIEGRLDPAGRPARAALGVLLAALVAYPLVQEEPRLRAALARIEARLPRPFQGLVLPRPRVSMRHHYMAARYARGVLEALPPDTVFVMMGDGRIFSVLYEQRVNGRRPDVLTVAATLLDRAWYRERLAEELPIPDLALLPTDSRLDAVVAAAESEGRPVYLNLPFMTRTLRERAVAVKVPLPRLGPADRVVGDADTLYRLEPGERAPGS